MTIINKIIRLFLVLIFVALVFSPFWIKLVPIKSLSGLLGKVQVVDKFLCSYSIKASGESMNPIIPAGEKVNLTRCFEEKDLTEGTIVLFNDGENLRFGLIRHVLPLAPIVYIVSNEKFPQGLRSVVKSEIIAIASGVDTKKTKYEKEQDAQSFILKPDEFISELYLAKIPKGQGIETSRLEKANTFSLQKDKFCFFIIPKVKMTTVEIEIQNAASQNITSLGENIVFEKSEKPNINCQDFGSGKGMLNLKQGDYYFRFLLDHQVLENLEFGIK